MHLSILIPTYNYVCTPLVAILAEQAARITGPEFEIIVGDDGSTSQAVLEANRAINQLPCCEYWETGVNSGRAAIRNRLYERSRGRWLLFLDGDGLPANDDFLSRYLAAVEETPCGVVCGGIVHPEKQPSAAQSLRWRYEREAERRMTVEWRNAHPHQNFRSFNFLIDRKSFSQIMFDEKIRRYGFEDNLFGESLRGKGIAVRHINNPMLNTDIEPNDLYVKKNEEALRTLAEHYESLSTLVRLSITLQRVEKLGLGWLLSLVYTATRPLLLKNLLSATPRVWVLNLYKAGYLRSLLRNRVVATQS